MPLWFMNKKWLLLKCFRPETVILRVLYELHVFLWEQDLLAWTLSLLLFLLLLSPSPYTQWSVLFNIMQNNSNKYQICKYQFCFKKTVLVKSLFPNIISYGAYSTDSSYNFATNNCKQKSIYRHNIKKL